MDIPTMKIERVPSPGVKTEPNDEDLSPYPEDDDIYEDPGDLDFTSAQQTLWLSHVPRSLWEAWASLADDDEVEIGTIRVEGSDTTPGRISLKLHDQIPQLKDQPREYNLMQLSQDKVKSRHGGPAFVFSEKDLQGYKSKLFAWNELDGDGNPGQGRSYLYERNKREQKRRENKKRFEPYARRPIPKQTAIAGAIGQEFECVPVKNEEFFALEAKQTKSKLQIPEKPKAIFVTGRHEPINQSSALLTMAEKASINKQTQAKRQAAKDSRAARVDRNVLIDRLLELFKMHRIWALRDLKARVNQPEAYLRKILDEIAVMWKSGDFTGKWELKEEYKESNAQLMNPASIVAPAAEDSEFERSGMDMDDDDENQAFEDV